MMNKSERKSHYTVFQNLCTIEKTYASGDYAFLGIIMESLNIKNIALKPCGKDKPKDLFKDRRREEVDYRDSSKLKASL